MYPKSKFQTSIFILGSQKSITRNTTKISELTTTYRVKILSSSLYDKNVLGMQYANNVILTFKYDVVLS